MRETDLTLTYEEQLRNERNTLIRLVLFGILALFGLLIFARSCTMISAGEVGVGTLFGDVRDGEYESGLSFRNPLIRVREMNIRTQEVKETMSVPTNEGLNVSLEVSVLYHLEGSDASRVYETLGNEEAYFNNFVQPSIRNAVRDAVTAYKAEALYSTAREKVAEDIRADLDARFKGRGFVLEAVLIRDLQLPQGLAAAIERKQVMEQRISETQFSVAREEQEANRKRAEAAGIRDAQKVIDASLTEEYLVWYYIQTLHSLVNSPNNTVVVLPFDQNLVPLMNMPTK